MNKHKSSFGLIPIDPIDNINSIIKIIRGQKVILSTDLARLYEVEPKVLMQAVKRNTARFPEDFMFQLTAAEMNAHSRSQIVTLKQDKNGFNKEESNLKSQIVTSSWGGSRRALPYAFTEQGVAMLSSILRSERAIKVNIEIMRAFVRMRYFLLTNTELAQRIDNLEKKYDRKFKIIFDAFRALMNPPEDISKNPIGFDTSK